MFTKWWTSFHAASASVSAGGGDAVATTTTGTPVFFILQVVCVMMLGLINLLERMGFGKRDGDAEMMRDMRLASASMNRKRIEQTITDKGDDTYILTDDELRVFFMQDPIWKKYSGKTLAQIRASFEQDRTESSTCEVRVG